MNTSIRLLTSLGFTAFLLACQSTSTNVDYDPDTNFNQFTAYQFTVSKEAKAKQLDPLTSDRIKEAISANLAAKSLSAVEKDADIQVSYFTTLEQREKKSSFSIGLGGSNRTGSGSTGVGLGTTIPLDSTYNVYTQITIDISKDGKLIWRGFDGFEIEQGTPPVEKHQEITNVVNAILANYPPKPAG